MSVLPRRHSDLTAREIDSDVVVFNTRTYMAHTLSGPAAAVWPLCDGTTTVTSAATELGLDRATVEAACGELIAADIVESISADGITRRRALKGSAIAAGGLLISSVAFPRAAAAASGGTASAPIGQGGDFYGGDGASDIGVGQYLNLPAGTVITGYDISAAQSNGTPGQSTYYEIFAGTGVGPHSSAALSVTAPGISAASGLYSIRGLHYVVPASGDIVFGVRNAVPGDYLAIDDGYGAGGFSYYFDDGSRSYTYPPPRFNLIYTLYGVPAAPTNHVSRRTTTVSPQVLSHAGAPTTSLPQHKALDGAH